MKRWLKTAGLAILSGGIVAAVRAAFDPQKYDIMHDIGSGRLWVHFFGGSAIAFVALLLNRK